MSVNLWFYHNTQKLTNIGQTIEFTVKFGAYVGTIQHNYSCFYRLCHGRSTRYYWGVGVGPQTISKPSWTGTFQVNDVSSALLSTLNFFCYNRVIAEFTIFCMVCYFTYLHIANWLSLKNSISGCRKKWFCLLFLDYVQYRTVKHQTPESGPE